LTLVETTAFGQTAKTSVAGLVDNSVTLEFHQDYATSSIEQTIYPTLGTAVTIAVKPVMQQRQQHQSSIQFFGGCVRMDSVEWCRGRLGKCKRVLANLRRNYKDNNLIKLGGK
jgi:hypothetical protein